jgi:predicted Zn-ribbon and HTH transcriptional regulator
MKLIKNKKEIEEPITDVSFHVHKFNRRPKPKNPKKILIVSCFTEFGCETLIPLYCLPRVLQEYPGMYVIVMGWYGREYFYRHLVDEYWELKEDYQWLRDYAKAFHNVSKNLAKIEKSVSTEANFCPASYLASFVIGNRCKKCRHTWIDNHLEKCPKCDSEYIISSLFSDPLFWKRTALPLPLPANDKLEVAKSYLGKNPVAIFARGRKTYGRNLQPEFYIKLISLLEDMGYDPIWLGEKQSTQPCPVDHIVDFSRMEESRDLELTFSIVSQCKFTIQFWTASTRLAGMLKVPYLLFESPDQIWGRGQEGLRRTLCDLGPSKLCVNHFWKVYNDHSASIGLVKKCIEEMEQNNFEDVIGLVEEKIVVDKLKSDNLERIGGIA